MSTTSVVVLLVAVVVVLLVLGVGAATVTRARQRRALQGQFGPEYGRTVDATGDRKQAELDLSNRVRQRQNVIINPVSAAQRNRYQQEWRHVQGEFVDSPGTALGHADSPSRA
jgi:hypothetical protein